MRKILAVFLALVLACAMILPIYASDGDDTTNVAFPGSSIGGFGSAAGLWIDPGQYFAQAFNTNTGFVGFVMTAWASAGSTADYALYTYNGSVEDSIEEGEEIVFGTAEFPEANPSGFEVLFEEDDPVPAGKYVLVISVSMGRCGLTVQPGSEETEFACSEDAAIIDNFGMSFDPTDGDPTVMTGGLIFTGKANADSYRSIKEEGLNTPAKETPAPTPEETATPDANADSTAGADSTASANSTVSTESASKATPAASNGTNGAPGTDKTDGSDGGGSLTWVIIAAVIVVVIAAAVCVIIVKKKKK